MAKTNLREDVRAEEWTLVLLPGLHGTSGLFQPFIERAPAHVRIHSVDYPRAEKLGYQALVHQITSRLMAIKGPFLLLGESFAGPLALHIAAYHRPENLVGVILSASFISRPNLWLGTLVPWTLVFAAANLYYAPYLALAPNAKRPLLQLARDEVRKSPPQLLAHRLRETYRADAAEALKLCPVPIAYLRGSRDHVVPKRNLDQILAIRPDTQVYEFAASHLVMQKRPDEAWRAIEDFGSRVFMPAPS